MAFVLMLTIASAIDITPLIINKRANTLFDKWANRLPFIDSSKVRKLICEPQTVDKAPEPRLKDTLRFVISEKSFLLITFKHILIFLMKCPET